MICVAPILFLLDSTASEMFAEQRTGCRQEKRETKKAAFQARRSLETRVGKEAALSVRRTDGQG